MKLPRFNAVITFLDSLGNKIVPSLTPDGRIQVNTRESFSPFVGASAPSSPAVGDHWFNTAANQNLLYAYDGTEWLSAAEFQIPFGEDTLDGGQAAWAGINGAGGGTQIQFPRDAKLTALTVQIRAGNNNKQFFLQINGVTSQTVTLPGADHITVFPNLDVDVGEEFWIAGNGAGGNVQDVTFVTWWRWRA